MMSNTISFDDSTRLICSLLECRSNRLFGDLHRLTRKPMDLARDLDAIIQSMQVSLKKRNEEWANLSPTIRTDGLSHSDGSPSYSDGQTVGQLAMLSVHTCLSFDDNKRFIWLDEFV